MISDPDSRSVNTGAAAVVGNRTHHQIKKHLPIIDTIRANDDLAVTWTMHFNSRVVAPNACRAGVTKDHATLAAAENFASTGVIRWIEGESLTRHTSGDESLSDAKRCPRFGAAR